MKIIKNKALFLLIAVALLMVTLTSCGACSGVKYGTLYDEEKAKKTTEAANQIEWVIEKLTEEEERLTTPDEEGNLKTEEEVFNGLKEKAKEIIESYPNFLGISGKNTEEKASSNYKVILIKNDIEIYKGYIDAATSKNKDEMLNYDKAVQAATNNSCFSCFFAQTNVDAQEKVKSAGDQKNIYDIVAIFTLQVKERMQEGEPLHFYADSFGDFMGHIFNNLFIFPVGWLLYAISKLCGGFYIIGLVITTLLIRTLGWPIYAKTNDMSLKMKAIEPEVAKIQAKYANRTDPDSKRMMQMEQARLYKQNGIGVGGCLMPFLQFPIFMAVYRAISRIPYTIATPGTKYTLNWGGSLNSKIFNLDLFQDYTSGTSQLIWIIILVVLVSGTQFISQLLSEKRQKAAKNKAQEDVPMYRRQAVAQQANDTQRTMKIVMYLMIFMMAVFVWTSKAGLGVYWLIGNCYSMFQMYINSKQSEKKLEKLKQQKGYK